MTKTCIAALQIACIACSALAVPAAGPVITPSRPNIMTFPARNAKFVRFVIHGSSSDQPCIDEIEVYGPGGKGNLALADKGSKASASSCLEGYSFHTVPHLNDGRYGNNYSWIAATGGREWAEIELPEISKVSKVIFTRDRLGRYTDRVPVSFEIKLSTDGESWDTVKKVMGVVDLNRQVQARTVSFSRQHARFVRIYILATKSGKEPRIDEIELYGAKWKQDPSQDGDMALARNGCRAEASSFSKKNGATGADKLNDGMCGRDYSWKAGGRNRQWAQIEFPRPAEVERIVFICGEAGRAPEVFEVRLSMDGSKWKTVARRGRGVVASASPPPGNGDRQTAAASPDDLKVPGSDRLGFANLALFPGAKAEVSSSLAGYDIHKAKHLNDGYYGNSHSWVAARNPCWAGIDLAGDYWIYKVAFGSDSSGRYNDRAATYFTIQATLDKSDGPGGKKWTTVVRKRGIRPVHFRTEFSFKTIRARRVRILAKAANSSSLRIDEIEIYGQKLPIPPALTGPLPDYPAAEKTGRNESLRRAFLGEEYAWLKTFGRADMDQRLVDYVRVWKYPKHVDPDRLPLPQLAAYPRLDGRLDDACWKNASRAVVRVAYPENFDENPLIEHGLLAGWKDGFLFLAIRTDRLLSGNVAVVSSDDWKGLGVVACGDEGLQFNTYGAAGNTVKLERSKPVEGTFNKDFTACEIKLPLSMFPGCRNKGLRVGLGMGGRHTSRFGRGVEFSFSSLAIAEEVPCVDGIFRVRLSSVSKGKSVTVRGTTSSLVKGLFLEPGQSKIIKIPAKPGPIGPSFDLEIKAGPVESYSLHLFRYDPLERVLSLFEDMVDRFAEKGLDIQNERKELKMLRIKQAELMSAGRPGGKAERRALLKARMAKHRLFMRDPDLLPMKKILCVKRHNFEPSHNYSVNLDSRGGTGGSINILEIPRENKRFEPEKTRVVKLFDAGNGIARNPMADFNAGKIYFGYLRSKGGYYHIMSMNSDGTGLKQITDGPFHDYWPCPLPDGGLAFITTRCKSRFLCWRPQAAVLFRMEADGSLIRPLSFANLTEWGPSVMTDGRIIWQRSEYVDKGADFSHTLWAIRPDGRCPELVFGNTIIQPNGYASGREVPGTSEICCVLISHFGDLNGPVALIDLNKGRFNPGAITSITPEVPWPGLWPAEECFRDPVPLSKDYFLCAHAPGRRFGIYVIDRFGNRELIYDDLSISTMCPTIFRRMKTPPVLSGAEERGEPGAGEYSTKEPACNFTAAEHGEPMGEFFVMDVYNGISPPVKRGTVKYIRVSQEVRADLEKLSSGEYRRDHPDFMDWYATPVHLVNGPYGWPSYVAKASWGIIPVEEDGSARFLAPAGRTLYFHVLDKDFNELQRMRSVVQLQPGEKRSCIGCHESRRLAPLNGKTPKARKLRRPQLASWEGKPFSFERIVQPVLNANCIRCHDAKDRMGINLTGTLDINKIPASYRTLISRGLVHYADYSYNPGGNEELKPLSLGTVRSRLWEILNQGHYDTKLTKDEVLRVKTWIDLNCPLWPDYIYRPKRPGGIKGPPKIMSRLPSKM